jgi:hypothetical protein
MAEPIKYFDNVTLGQFVLTGIPLDVFVDGKYLRITAVDDIEDPMYGFGMDADGAMHEFDYRMIDHILVSSNNVTLDAYNKAMGNEPAGAEEEPEEESPKKEESTMKLKPMIEKAIKKSTNEDVNSARQKVQKEKENVAKAEEKLANAQGVYAKEKMKSAKMEENADVTTLSEPYIYKVGDLVRNTNPNCVHYGSMGIIQKLLTLPDNMGTLVKYTVTNDGETYSAGDSLTKTMDQLTLAHDDEEIDFNDYSDDLDDYDVVDYDFGDDDDDDDEDDLDDTEDYEYYDDEEDED